MNSMKWEMKEIDRVIEKERERNEEWESQRKKWDSLSVFQLKACDGKVRLNEGVKGDWMYEESILWMNFSIKKSMKMKRMR